MLLYTHSHTHTYTHTHHTQYTTVYTTTCAHTYSGMQYHTHTQSHTLTHSYITTLSHKSHTHTRTTAHTHSTVGGEKAQKQTRLHRVLMVWGATEGQEKGAEVCFQQPGSAIITHSLAPATHGSKAAGVRGVSPFVLSLIHNLPAPLLPELSPWSFAAFAEPRAPFQELPLGLMNRWVFVCVCSPLGFRDFPVPCTWAGLH